MESNANNSKEEINSRTGIVKYNDDVNNLQLDLIRDRDNSLLILDTLVKSGKIPAQSVEEAAVYYLKSKELNIPFLTSMSHMHIINGKSGVDVHVLKALLLRAGGIIWDVIRDFEPQYEYTDGTNVLIFPFDVPHPYKVVWNADTTNEAKRDGLIPISRKKTSASTWVTEYSFQRQIKMLNGTINTLTAKGKFSYSDAIANGLHLKKDGTINDKSPWITYPSMMVDHRAWTFGARAIGSDILFGLMELSELYDLNKKPYIVDAEGKVIE